MSCSLALVCVINGYQGLFKVVFVVPQWLHTQGNPPRFSPVLVEGSADGVLLPPPSPPSPLSSPAEPVAEPQDAWVKQRPLPDEVASSSAVRPKALAEKPWPMWAKLLAGGASTVLGIVALGAWLKHLTLAHPPQVQRFAFKGESSELESWSRHLGLSLTQLKSSSRVYENTKRDVLETAQKLQQGVALFLTQPTQFEGALQTANPLERKRWALKQMNLLRDTYAYMGRQHEFETVLSLKYQLGLYGAQYAQPHTASVPLRELALHPSYEPFWGRILANSKDTLREEGWYNAQQQLVHGIDERLQYGFFNSAKKLLAMEYHSRLATKDADTVTNDQVALIIHPLKLLQVYSGHPALGDKLDNLRDALEQSGETGLHWSRLLKQHLGNDLIEGSGETEYQRVWNGFMQWYGEEVEGLPDMGITLRSSKGALRVNMTTAQVQSAVGSPGFSGESIAAYTRLVQELRKDPYLQLGKEALLSWVELLQQVAHANGQEAVAQAAEAKLEEMRSQKISAQWVSSLDRSHHFWAWHDEVTKGWLPSEAAPQRGGA